MSATLRSILAAAGVLGAALAACSDDGGGGRSTKVESGVPAEKQASDMTADEAADFCAAAERAGAAVVTPERACKMFGVLFTEDAASCNQLVTLCRANPGAFEGDEEEEEADCPLADEAKRRECDATVGELETCLSDSLAATAQTLDRLSCAQAGNEDLLGSLMGGEGGAFGDLADEAKRPASCAPVAVKCPVLFGEALDPGPQPHPDAGPSDPDAGPSDPDAGPSDPDAGPSDSDAGV